MDLAFTPEEQQFRKDIRTWVSENLPADISNKVHNALRLSRDDMQRWAKMAGWATPGRRHLAARAGTQSRSICLRRNAPWLVPRA
jgi:hypothetical protein